jgi:hypothetical protein
VIALRGSYDDDFKRKHITWSLANTWNVLSKHRVVYMTIHIHVMKEKKMKPKPYGEKGTFSRYKVSHMEIDYKEHKDLKMNVHIPLFQLITLHIIRKS